MRFREDLLFHKKRYLIILGSVLVVIPVLFYFLVLPTVNIFRAVKGLGVKIRPLKDSLLLYDLSRLETEANKLEPELNLIQNNVNKLRPFAYVPFLGAYVRDAQNLSAASLLALKAVSQFLVTIRPFGPSLGFRVEGVDEPLAAGQERLAGLAQAAPTIARELPSLREAVEMVSQRVAAVNPGRYPRQLASLALRDKIESLRRSAFSLNRYFNDLQGFLKVLPDLLAGAGRKNYLILFQNDKEIRPTGGFLTAYAVFTLDKGKIVSARSGDMYFLDIDNRVPFYPKPPTVIAKYLKIDRFYIRDANLSPDFPTSAKAVEEIWNRVPNLPPVDGLIALDTHFVENLLDVLGEINIPGYEKFTKDNVVSQLELFSTVIGTRLEKRQARKDLIGVLMQQMLAKAFTAGGKQYLNLISAIWKEAEQKHLLLYFHDEEAQSLAEKFNFAGRVKDYSGDYLHINDANFAGRKANWFIKEEVSKTVVFSKDRFLTTLKIDYENTGPYHADYNTGYRDYVRVYVPAGSTLLESEGSLETIETGEDLGKTYFAGYVAVDPLKKVRLTLKYETPRRVIEGNVYRLLIQKQPGTDRFKYEVKVGRQSENFELLEDKEIEIKM